MLNFVGLDNYFIISSVVIGILFILLISAVCFRKFKKKIIVLPQPVQSTYVVTSKDIRAIAGDNMLTTQLDLARAYIEINKKSLAKKILQHVLEHGQEEQQYAARRLLSSL